MQVGASVDVPVTLAGPLAFGRAEPLGTQFDGLTGIASGLTADEGSGAFDLELRHDATLLGNLTALGIASANAGADDSFLGDATLTIDEAAGTIQLGEGPLLALPDPTSESAADFVVQNARGGELHLDFTGYTGGDFADTVTGEGSISLDGETYVALDFTETDLELRDPTSGTVLHVDTTDANHGRARASSSSASVGPGTSSTSWVTSPRTCATSRDSTPANSFSVSSNALWSWIAARRTCSSVSGRWVRAASA